MAARREGDAHAAVAVATSQQAWGEALASLLAARDVPAVAVDAAGRPWAADRADAAPSRWTVVVVDAADAAAGRILTDVEADARVGVGSAEPGAPGGVDVWVDVADPRGLVAAARDPRGAARQRPRRTARRPGELTARERTVLDQLRAGRTNAEIAHRLDMSPNTVRTHVQNILGKLGVRNRFEAAVIANDGGPAEVGR